MRFESQIELHSPSLFLYNDTPFYGCVAGNDTIHIVELQTGKTATMEFKDYPGFEWTVSQMLFSQDPIGYSLTIIILRSHTGSALGVSYHVKTLS